MTWHNFRKHGQVFWTINISWQNPNTMVCRNQAFFRSWLSAIMHFVLALISWGGEGTWHSARSNQHVQGQGFKQHISLPSLSWWWCDREIGSWLCLGMVGNQEPWFWLPAYACRASFRFFCIPYQGGTCTMICGLFFLSTSPIFYSFDILCHLLIDCIHLVCWNE